MIMLRKACTVLGLSAMMCMVTSVTAFAKEERTEIPKINLNVQYTPYTDDRDLEVTTDGVGYEVSEYYFMDDDIWDRYDENDNRIVDKYYSPLVAIELYADDNYYFKKATSSYFDFYGDAISFVSCTRSGDKDCMTVMICVKPENGHVGNPTDVTWKSNGYASWRPGYANTHYVVQLFKENNSIGTFETKNSTYDFRRQMYDKGPGVYRYKVYGETTSNTKSTSYYKSQWVESGLFEVTQAMIDFFNINTNDGSNSNLPSVGPGGGVTNLTPGDEKPIDPQGHRMSEAERNNKLGPGESGLVKGWLKDSYGWWYREKDLSWPKATWKQIDGVWYHFDEKGYMQTGWIYDGGKWYMLADHGGMMTGWVLSNGKWYWMDETGAMVTGYKKINGATYYFTERTDDTSHPFGAMYCNEVCPNGKTATESGSLK